MDDSVLLLHCYYHIKGGNITPRTTLLSYAGFHSSQNQGLLQVLDLACQSNLLFSFVKIPPFNICVPVSDTAESSP